MKRKILLILSISFALLSCNDFLEEIPRHQWEMSVAVSTYAGAEQAVNGIYGASLLTDNLNGKTGSVAISQIKFTIKIICKQ